MGGGDPYNPNYLVFCSSKKPNNEIQHEVPQFPRLLPEAPRAPSSCPFPRTRSALHQPNNPAAVPRGLSALHRVSPEGERGGMARLQGSGRLRHFVPLAARPAREPKMAAARLRRRATAKRDTVPIPQRGGAAAAIFNLTPPPRPCNGKQTKPKKKKQKEKSGRPGYEAHSPPAAAPTGPFGGGLPSRLPTPGPPGPGGLEREARWDRGRPRPPRVPARRSSARRCRSCLRLLSPLPACTEAVTLPPSLQRLRRGPRDATLFRVALSRRAPHCLSTGLTLPDVTPRSLTWARPLP